MAKDNLLINNILNKEFTGYMGKMFPNATNINVFQTDVIQVSSFLFILLMIYVLAKSFKSLSGNWLQTDSLHDEKYVLSSYETVINFDEAKEKKKSILFSIPFLIGAGVSIYFKMTGLCILLTLIAVFMLMQHNIGYKIAKKDINKEFKNRPQIEHKKDFKKIEKANKKFDKKDKKISKTKYNKYQKFDKKNNKLTYNHNKRYYPHKNKYQYKHYNKKAKFNPYYKKHNHFAKRHNHHRHYAKYNNCKRPSYYR